MLKNHSKPPGPSNRGERSELKADKRPIADQIMSNIRDTEQPSKDGKEYADLKNMMYTVHDDIDDFFHERDMEKYFKNSPSFMNGV